MDIIRKFLNWLFYDKPEIAKCNKCKKIIPQESQKRDRIFYNGEECGYRCISCRLGCWEY